MDSDVPDYSEDSDEIRLQHCLTVNLYSGGVDHGRESKGIQTPKQYSLYFLRSS